MPKKEGMGFVRSYNKHVFNCVTLINNPMREGMIDYHSRYTDKKAETLKDSATDPKSQNW